MGTTFREPLASLERLALGLWLGALLAFGLIFAPQAFKAIPDLAVFARLIAATLRALAVFGFACGGVALLALLARAVARPVRLAALRMLLILAMIGVTAFETFSIIPAMEGLHPRFRAPFGLFRNADPARGDYDRLHRESTRLYELVVLLGLGAFALTSLDNAPGRR